MSFSLCFASSSVRYYTLRDVMQSAALTVRTEPCKTNAHVLVKNTIKNFLCVNTLKDADTPCKSKTQSLTELEFGGNLHDTLIWSITDTAVLIIFSNFLVIA